MYPRGVFCLSAFGETPRILVFFAARCSHQCWGIALRRVGAHAFELSVATMTSNRFRPVLDIATDGGFGETVGRLPTRRTPLA